MIEFVHHYILPFILTIGLFQARLAVRYGTVRNYGTIYFPRYGTVLESTIFFSYFYRTFFVPT